MNPELAKAKAKLEQAEKAKARVEALKVKIEEWEAEEKRLRPLKDSFEFSETGKKRLDRLAIEIRTGRKDHKENAQTRKGILQEEESIVIYSKYRGQSFTKNIIRIKKRRMSGEFDLDEENRKRKRVLIIDIKTRWGVHTFFIHHTGKMKRSEEVQLECYNMIAECEEAEIANVLTNNHPDEIDRILYYESLKYRDPKDPDKVIFDIPTARKIEILKDHIFDYETLDKYLDGEYMDEEALEAYNSFIEIPLSERVIRQNKKADAELQAEIEAVIPHADRYLAEIWNIHHVEPE